MKNAALNLVYIYLHVQKIVVWFMYITKGFCLCKIKQTKYFKQCVRLTALYIYVNFEDLKI